MDIKGFLAHITLQDRRPSTIRKHEFVIKKLADSISAFTKQEVDSYLASLKTSGRRNKYLNSIIESVRLYARYIGSELESYPMLRNEDYQAATLSLEEIKKILEMPFPTYLRYSKGASYRKEWDEQTLGFEILSLCGLRPYELSTLSVETIDFGRNVLIIPDIYSKTRKGRVVPIPLHLIPKLQKKVAERESGFIFPRKTKTGFIEPNKWAFYFRQRIKLLGINRPNLTCYSLRHSYISTMVTQEGVDLASVAALVGHSDIRQTQHYIHLSTERLQKIAVKHPMLREGNAKAILQSIYDSIKSLELAQDGRFDQKLTIKGGKLYFSITLKR